MQTLKTTILLFSIFIISILSAGAQDVIRAEYDFADYVKSHSLKQGFLKFMDSAAVTFVRGGDTVNAVKFWQKLPESSDIMVWKPAFHATSKAADLAFTTGPYEAKASVNGQILGFGQYTTIWKKDKKGEWKFLLDIGTSTTDNLLLDKVVLSQFKEHTSNKKDTLSVLNIEKSFIKQYAEIGVNVYRNYLVKNSWFNVAKTNPLTESELILETLNKQLKVEFEPINSYMSKSRDLAFVYGKIISQNKKSNYLRIWAHTKMGWKILVQVQQ